MSFHSVLFPLDISYGSSGGPQYSTDIAEMISGFEQRNINWSAARLRYNVAYGVRTEAQLEALLSFFRARQGRAFGFRFRDWTDYKSCPNAATPAPTDQLIGTGTGAQTVFQLIKNYTSGSTTASRSITKPASGTVRVAVQNVELTSGWSVDVETGLITFTSAPGAGLSVKTGYEFHTPMRFDTDYLPLSLDSYGVGSAGDVPLVEVRV
jgi:uncharacterized protein (TIGR02217 family)